MHEPKHWALWRDGNMRPLSQIEAGIREFGDKFQYIRVLCFDEQGLPYAWTTRDDCESCNGARGGVPGNENLVDGALICDYCHADLLQRRRV